MRVNLFYQHNILETDEEDRFRYDFVQDELDNIEKQKHFTDFFYEEIQDD